MSEVAWAAAIGEQTGHHRRRGGRGEGRAVLQEKDDDDRT